MRGSGVRAEHCASGLLPTAISALLLLATVGLAPAQTGSNILLVANGRSPVSIRIAGRYAETRGVPPDQIVRLDVDTVDEVPRATYDRQIEVPISEWLGRERAHDRILYIVLTKDVPLRIAGTLGREGTVSSVDSELALLYRRMAAMPTPIAGRVPNPYFLGDRPVEQSRRFRHSEHDIYLVTRLDGFTESDVMALIDRGREPTEIGRIVLDGRAGWNDPGNDWLRMTAAVLASHGFADRILLDVTSQLVGPVRDVLGYYCWGSNDPAVKTRRPDLTFVPGAIGGAFVSGDARTFAEPPEEWVPGSMTERRSFYAGAPHSLTGDLVRAGLTGVSGQVAEPYLDGSVRPNILLPAYASGLNLAEAYYLAIPYLSWRTVVVGDPLCSPFRRRPLEPSELDPGLDPATEFPIWFGARRLRAVRSAAPEPLRLDAVRAAVKADARLARGDQEGARHALEEATSIDPRYTAAQLALASLYDSSSQYDLAIIRYRLALSQVPTSVVALNNLAYALAVRKNQPQEALALAEKAASLAPNDSRVADTLAWVQHLLGRQGEALGILQRVVKQLPDSAEVWYHLASVMEATGDLPGAATALQRALDLDSGLADRDDVQTLKQRLGIRSRHYLGNDAGAR